ncbi:MAG: restriction endonuclease, partial [Candidatus Kapabacteria bacterium]|nr:restriction endonuclease [Candidatus Kapabacteria bacterium]
PGDLLDLSPTEFENMVVELYSAMGHKAYRTGATGDHGIDIVVRASNGEKWVVQCKRWRGYVGEPVVRDFYGAMHHEKADKGAIITTGVFTPQARAWAKGKPITLLDGKEFFEYLKKARALAKGTSTSKA